MLVKHQKLHVVGSFFCVNSKRKLKVLIIQDFLPFSVILNVKKLLLDKLLATSLRHSLKPYF